MCGTTSGRRIRMIWNWRFEEVYSWMEIYWKRFVNSWRFFQTAFHTIYMIWFWPGTWHCTSCLGEKVKTTPKSFFCWVFSTLPQSFWHHKEWRDFVSSKIGASEFCFYLPSFFFFFCWNFALWTLLVNAPSLCRHLFFCCEIKWDSFFQETTPCCSRGSLTSRSSDSFRYQ